jgi:hypothetical protein
VAIQWLRSWRGFMHNRVPGPANIAATQREINFINWKMPFFSLRIQALQTIN